MFGASIFRWHGSSKKLSVVMTFFRDETAFARR
jgi:hypothetical protein